VLSLNLGEQLPSNRVFFCVAYDVEEEPEDASVRTSLIDEPDSPSPPSPTKSVDELLQVRGMFEILRRKKDGDWFIYP